MSTHDAVSTTELFMLGVLGGLEGAVFLWAGIIGGSIGFSLLGLLVLGMVAFTIVGALIDHPGGGES